MSKSRKSCKNCIFFDKQYYKKHGNKNIHTNDGKCYEPVRKIRTNQVYFACWPNSTPCREYIEVYVSSTDRKIMGD